MFPIPSPTAVRSPGPTAGSPLELFARILEGFLQAFGAAAGVKPATPDAFARDGRPATARAPSPTPASRPTAPTVPASELILADHTRTGRAAAAQSSSRPAAAPPAPPPNTSAPAVTAPTVAPTGPDDATRQTSIAGDWKSTKDSQDWGGRCNEFAREMMWSSGADVKPKTEARRKELLAAALEAHDQKRPARGAPAHEKAAFERERRQIQGRFAAKNMHNYLPPVTTAAGEKAHRGDSMSALAAKLKDGTATLKPGATIHVKMFPNEAEPYGSKTRDANNPKDQGHHWFTYAGTNKDGEPVFADSMGKARTAAECDAWLERWTAKSAKAGVTTLGDYTSMNDRLEREGRLTRDANGNGRVAAGTKPTIEAVYDPHAL